MTSNHPSTRHRTVDANTPRVFVLAGELDISTAPQACAPLIAAAHDPGDLIVDLHAVDFADACTINLLLRASHVAHSNNHTLTLRQPSQPVRRIIATLQLDAALPTE